MKKVFLSLVLSFTFGDLLFAQTGQSLLRLEAESLLATEGIAQSSLDYFIEHAWNEDYGAFISDLNKRDLSIIDLSRLLYSLSYSSKPEHRYYTVKLKNFILKNMLQGDTFIESASIRGQNLVPHQPESLTSSVQAYGLTGLVAYYDVFRDAEVLEKVRSLFDAFVGRFHDQQGRGFFDQNVVLDPDPTPRLYTKSYNSTVYVATSFLFELHRVDVERRSTYETYLIELSDLVASKFIDETGWIAENFDRDWNPSWRTWQADNGKSIGIVGHNVQASWMLLRASLLPGASQKLTTYRQAALTILRSMMNGPALDRQNGGVYNAFVRETNKPKWGLSKHWWQQAEAMMCWSLALHLDLLKGEEQTKVADALAKTAAFYRRFFYDKVKGGVFPEVNEDGSVANPDEPKVRIGTGAYHEVELARMLRNDLLANENEATLSSQILRITHNLPASFAGRGRHKAAFLVFATPSDIRSPGESIERYKVLRERGIPTDGFYLEAEHTGLNPEVSRPFVALAEQNGFRVMIRPPSLSVDSAKSWNSLGHSGLIVPLTNSTADIDAGFKANHYNLGRPIGFEVDTRFLTSGAPRDRTRVDAERTLAFMIEDYTAAEDIDALASYTAAQARKFHIDPKHVAFWLGPYDMAADTLRLKYPDWDEGQVKKYVADRIGAITTAAVRHGLTMAGHVDEGKTALNRIAQGWTAFTYDGMFSGELFSAQSVSQRFGEEAGDFLATVRQDRRYTNEERAKLRGLQDRLQRLLGCEGGFATEP